MNPTDLRLNTTTPSWMKQVLSDIERHEGYRQYAYPDPLSKIGKTYGAAKYKWGFAPARPILASLGLSEGDGRPWTVGQGFTLGVTVDSTLAKPDSLRRLQDEVMKHAAGLDRLIPGWNKTLPVYVITVLVNMIYNLGYERLSKFDTTLSLIKQGKYAMAGTNLRKTAWFKQVKTRGVELVDRLESGRIAPEHLV